MTIPYCECGPSGPEIKTARISVEPGTYTPDLQKLYETSANLAMLGCVTQGRLTIPDWWQTRIGSDRPVLSILYRENNGGRWGDYYHTVNIPHYAYPQGYKPTLPIISKGKYQATAILKDNSKIIINGSSMAEARKAINQLVQLTGQYASDATITISERKDELKKVRTKAVRGSFFSTGYQNSNPDWTIELYKL